MKFTPVRFNPTLRATVCADHERCDSTDGRIGGARQIRGAYDVEAGLSMPQP
jgi:hypothetical protein